MKKKKILKRVAPLLDIRTDLAKNGITVDDCCGPQADGTIECAKVRVKNFGLETTHTIIGARFTAAGWEFED